MRGKRGRRGPRPFGEGRVAHIARTGAAQIRHARQERHVDQTAEEVAQEVYETCVAVRSIEDGTPLILRGPAYAIAYRAAPMIVRTCGLPRDEQTLQDIAAYIVVGISAIVAGFDVEHFKAWREGNLKSPESGIDDEAAAG